MKSPEVFWNIIADYHARWFGFELFMTLTGLVLTVILFIKPSQLPNALMKIYLAFSFVWLAFVFFWGLDKSPLGTFFVAPLFTLIALLFLADLRSRKIEFVLPPPGPRRTTSYILFALVLLYPLVSFLLGHRYPRLTTLYLPCPLTVFTLALLSAALPRVDVKIYILLLVWGMMALPKVFGLFDVREDTILFATGIYSLVLLVRHWKDIRLLKGVNQ